MRHLANVAENKRQQILGDCWPWRRYALYWQPSIWLMSQHLILRGINYGGLTTLQTLNFPDSLQRTRGLLEMFVAPDNEDDRIWKHNEKVCRQVVQKWNFHCVSRKIYYCSIIRVLYCISSAFWHTMWWPLQYTYLFFYLFCLHISHSVFCFFVSWHD